MEQNPFDLESAAFAIRQSWEVHRQAFGPILEPAFAQNQQVRLVLTNALNHISRRDIRRSMELLKEIHPHCSCDEDRAAWAFFVGLCFEMAGARAQMLEWYEKAGQFGHRFHLPYLKLARANYDAKNYEQAGKYYVEAIGCLLEMEDRDEELLGSSYTNLTSCLTMLHRYPEAEAIWQEARRYPRPVGSDATAAILYAAMGDAEKTRAHLDRLANMRPEWLAPTRQMTDEILAGTHPDFPRQES